MSKQENFLIMSSTTASSLSSLNSNNTLIEILPRQHEPAYHNTYSLPSVNLIGVFEARFFVEVKRVNRVDIVDNVDKQTINDYNGIDSSDSSTTFSLYCQLTAYPEGYELQKSKLQTSTPLLNKIVDDLTDSFVNVIFAHIKKLCYLDYPCRLFQKILSITPEILEEGERIEALKRQLGDRFSPKDPTFFFVDAKLYAYLKYNFCVYKKYITALLANDYRTINTIRPDYLNYDATYDITCTMWEQIATEEREALIIFSLFFDPAAAFFVNPEPEQAKEAFNSFNEQISIWLRDALMPQKQNQNQLHQKQYKQEEQYKQAHYKQERSQADRNTNQAGSVANRTE